MNPQRQAMICSPSTTNHRRNFRPERANLNDIVRRAIGSLSPYLVKNTETRLHLAEDDLHLMADSSQMEEAITHLLRNAAEAMPGGGILTIGTALACHRNDRMMLIEKLFLGGCALLSIADTGIGMDKKDMERIFDPGFTTKPGTSQGLGLPAAHGIIRKHNGCINIQSVPGKGSTVKVYLPLLRTAVRHEEPPLSVQPFRRS